MAISLLNEQMVEKQQQECRCCNQSLNKERASIEQKDPPVEF